MSWEYNEFEQELQEYSEIETGSKEQVEVALPRTIQQYQQIIQSNNTSSIFDTDYNLDTQSNGPAKSDEDLGVFEDEKVRFTTSGTGRGRRNFFVKPGEVNRNNVLNGDDEVRQQIRKVAPIGYSNAITENAVRAIKISKVLEKDSDITGSPAQSKTSSPALSKASSKFDDLSPIKSKKRSNLSVESPSVSGKSTPCTTASDVQSSEYFTSQDIILTPSSSKCNRNQERSEGSDDEYSEEHSENSTWFTNKTELTMEVNTGAIPKKPLSLPLMLKEIREANKKRHLQQKEGLNIRLSTEFDENEMATRKTIKEILRQDRKEWELRRKQLTDQSSSSSLSSPRDETLSWRKRNDSPPRYAWGQPDWRREPRELDISSIKDFPALNRINCNLALSDDEDTRPT